MQLSKCKQCYGNRLGTINLLKKEREKTFLEESEFQIPLC